MGTFPTTLKFLYIYNLLKFYFERIKLKLMNIIKKKKKDLTLQNHIKV